MHAVPGEGTACNPLLLMGYGVWWSPSPPLLLGGEEWDPAKRAVGPCHCCLGVVRCPLPQPLPLQLVGCDVQCWKPTPCSYSRCCLGTHA